MSFKVYTIEECCDILNNLRFPLNSEQRFDMQGEFAYYGANGVQGYINQWRFDDDLILIAEDGGNFEQFATRPIAYRVSGKCWVNNHAHVLKAKEKFSQNFIFYSLQHKNILYFIAGGTRSKLTQGELKKIIINHPNISEANKIGDIISKADAFIAQTEALIAKYQHIKTGLMQDLLTRGIDEHGKIRSEQTHRFKTEKGLRVPEDWEVYEIGEITDHVGSGVTPKGGSNVYGHEGILLIRSQNVLIGEFDLDDVAYINPEINDRMQRSQLQDLDVLLNITGASIGRSHFVPIGFSKSNVNQHVCALRIKNSSLGKSLFVSSFLNSYEGQKQIKRLLGASNREGLNYQQIREIKLSMPKIEDDSEYQKIYSVLTSINTKIETLKNNLKKQKSLKIGLMQDLLAGKVRVKIKEETLVNP
jgi:type I restriction enzyme S subunit